MRIASLLLAATFVAAPLLASAQTTTTSTGTKMAPNASNAAAAAAAAAKASGAGTSGMPPAASTPMVAPSSGGMSKSASGDVGQYSSESAATSACSGDKVVWANSTSKALHMSGDRYYGKSKHGFYTCEKQALAGGYHVAGHHGSHKHAKTAKTA